MNTKNFNLFRSRGALALLAGIGLILPATQVKAQDQAYPMAPPVNNYGSTESVNNVYNWQDVPQNQIVPIDRAVFDQGGYQLYDQSGETIVVPFQNNNLYVMKFAVSHTGGVYFVNDAGQAPILYVPEGGYLENATVPGARWYPFNQRFAPANPVFLGIAPSYSDYVDMGWYPNEVCYGGYYGSVSFLDGGFFGPTLGLTFIFGGHPYYGWNGYRRYAGYYPAPYHVGYFDRNDYRIGGRPDFDRRESFIGSSGQRFHPQSGGFGVGGRGAYSGAGRPGFNQGQYPFGARPGSGGPTFPGGQGGVRFGSNGGRPSFGGGTRPTFGGTASRPGFSGGRPAFPGGQGGVRTGFGGTASRPGFSGGRPSFGGGSRPAFGGTASRPAFGGGGRPSMEGGGGSRPSFGGAGSGRPSFGGGARPGFGGGRPSGGGQAPHGSSAPSGGGGRGASSSGPRSGGR